MKKVIQVITGILFVLIAVLFIRKETQPVYAYSAGDKLGLMECNSKRLGHTCDCVDDNWEVIYVTNPLSCTNGQGFAFAHKCTVHPDANDNVCTASAYEVYMSHVAGSATLNKYANYGWQFGYTTRVYCGQHAGTTIPALGHSPSSWQYDSAQHWYTCTRTSCGKLLSNGLHTFGSPVLIDNNTRHRYTCTTCGYSYTEQIAFNVTVKSRQQNADGSYPDYSTVGTSIIMKGQPFTYTLGATSKWKAASGYVSSVTEDTTVYLDIERQTYTLSLAKGTGISSVKGAGSYRWGQSVSAYASVGSGYTWNGWSGTYSSKNNPYIFNMPVNNVSLTANAKNNPPTGVKLSAKKGTTTLATATQTSAASVSGWQNSSIGLALDAYDPGDGLKRMEVFRNDTGASVFARDYSAAKSTTTLNGTDNIEGTVTFHGVATDMAGQSTQTKDLTVKIDTKAPVVSTFDVTLGTYKNPVKTPLQRPDGYINTEGYGAKINIIARDTNGKAAKGSGDVSNIRHAYIEVSDPTGTNPSRIYTLLEDGSDKSTFVDTRIINVIRDFPRSIDLDYTLHVVDNAGNEFVQTKSTHREMEVYVTVERLTENGNTTNLTSNQFRGGYEGVVHIVTTGWVDTVSLAWPQDILDAGVIDGQFGLPVMDYNVTVDMNPENNPDILLRDDDGGSFTRCYDFPFWIPVYMEQVTGELDDETVIPYNVTGIGTRGEDIKQTQAPFFLGGGSVLNDIRSVIIR